MNGSQPEYIRYNKPVVPGLGLGIASMVIGIISCFFFYLIVPSILAIIFGVISKGKGYKRGMSSVGILLGSLSLVLLVLCILFIVINFFMIW